MKIIAWQAVATEYKTAFPEVISEIINVIYIA